MRALQQTQASQPKLKNSPELVNSDTDCPLCRSRSRRLFRLGHTSVYRCIASGCRLEFAHPQLNHHDLSRAYEHYYYPENDEKAAILENGTSFEGRRLVEAMEPFAGSFKNKRVLDYGCGRGNLLRVLASIGAKVVGVEQSEVARQEIERDGLNAFASIADLRESERQPRFDRIVMSDVVEHLREPWKELADLRDFLLPEGKLFLTTPNAASLRSRLTGARWDQRNNPTHFFYFTRRSLKAVLERAGFRHAVELPPVTDYRHHGVFRRWMQRRLASLGLHGGLLFAAFD